MVPSMLSKKNKQSRARLVKRWKDKLQNGAINEGVIWELPEPTADRPHGYKYRLNYTFPSGAYIRYDNGAGKKDHKHLGTSIEPYEFIDVNHLIEDFEQDVLQSGGIL